MLFIFKYYLLTFKPFKLNIFLNIHYNQKDVFNTKVLSMSKLSIVKYISINIIKFSEVRNLKLLIDDLVKSEKNTTFTPVLQDDDT